MNRGSRLLLVLLVLATGFAGRAPAASFTVASLATGLDHPWSIAFLPGGGLLVTERAGRLLRIGDDGRVTPVAGVPETYVRSQAGLFEVLLDPAFASTGRLYLSYAHGTDAANGLRVAAARLVDARLEALEVLFSAQPLKDTPVHYGGRMLLLPDHTLLVTTGDGFDYREAAQRLDNHLGKTIRIHRDGRIPADNPFLGTAGARPEIYSYGHRNPQGLALEPATGRVYLHEHGPRGGDELNVLEAGANYGWPVATEGLDYTGAHVTPYERFPGTVPPILGWTPSIAPAGMALYAGDAFPSWRGDLLVASLAERSVRVVELGAGDGARALPPLPLHEVRYRDVAVGPDGFVYLLTDAQDGAVLRLSPAE